jgi:hypothetical protein
LRAVGWMFLINGPELIELPLPPVLIANSVVQKTQCF